jgi:adenylyltransferase/sulfurtransferase
VREENEYLMWNLGGLLIPLSKINSQMDKIDISGAVVVHCKSGVRSEKAIKEIKKIKGEIEIYNLGING